MPQNRNCRVCAGRKSTHYRHTPARTVHRSPASTPCRASCVAHCETTGRAAGQEGSPHREVPPSPWTHRENPATMSETSPTIVDPRGVRRQSPDESTAMSDPPPTSPEPTPSPEPDQPSRPTPGARRPSPPGSETSLWEILGRQVGKGLRAAKHAGASIGGGAVQYLDRQRIEEDLDSQYRILGRLVAERCLGERRSTVEAGDPAVRGILTRIDELEQDLEAVRERDARHAETRADGDSGGESETPLARERGLHDRAEAPERSDSRDVVAEPDTDRRPNPSQEGG